MVLNQLKRLKRQMVAVFLAQPLLLLAMSAYANDTSNAYEHKNYLTHTLKEIFISPSKHLLSDTAGPSITLSIGTATDRNIALLDIISYYASTDCIGPVTGTTADITGGSPFVFEDGVPFFFGQEALSALSAGDATTQCIALIPNQASIGGRGAYVFIHIRNLSCDGAICTGGSVCQTGGSRWDRAAIPSC